jgi:diguanylate cyclase (GGDEF)-like protein
LLLIFTFVSILLTLLLAAMFFRNFDKLAAVTTGLSERISRSQPVDWPESNIYEINQLTYNFRVVTDKLGIIFQQITMANDQLLRQKDQLAASEERLHWLAYFDKLTGLPNRLQMKEKLEQLLAEAAPEKDVRFAVIFMDLDRFKQVNDTLGHSAGDELLQHVASRLLQLRSDRNMIFRHGGDEFAIVAADAGEEEALQLIQRIDSIVSAPIHLVGVSFYMTMSIGISVYPLKGGDADTMLKYAESAMYVAKERGGNGSMFYMEEMNARLSEKTWVEYNLYLALERREFTLYYQLKVDGETGKPVGMEALVRWEHPERGIIPPNDFIPIAEETGFIIPLGDWILREACEQNRRWQQNGFPPLRMAVNLSARQFYNPKLVETVRSVLEEVGMEPQYLELEVTEGYLVNDPEYVVGLLRELTDMGIYVSIDDFGTGYSSLGQLQRYPVHAVKIDQSFVRDIDSNHSNESIVRAMIQLAHSMDLHVVAEGVETEEERRVLRMYGSDALQGYLFSKPVPAPMFEELLRTEG